VIAVRKSSVEIVFIVVSPVCPSHRAGFVFVSRTMRLTPELCRPIAASQSN
jgi:hypothetical protein